MCDRVAHLRRFRNHQSDTVQLAQVQRFQALDDRVRVRRVHRDDFHVGPVGHLRGSSFTHGIRDRVDKMVRTFR